MKTTKIVVSTLAMISGLVACGGGSTPGGNNGGGGGGGGASREILYVASGSNGQGQILSFGVDPATGVLSSPTRFPAPQFLFEFAPDPSGAFLYGSDFDAGAVRVYSVSSSTGALTEMHDSPFSSPLSSGNAGPIAVSPNGKFLFYSNASGDITTFSISAGSLAPGATVVQDMNQPVRLAVDPAGKFLYAANLSDTIGGQQFSVFAIDPISGALSSVNGSPFGFQGNSGPYGIVVHPSGNFLYSALSNAAGVDALSVNRSTGALALIPPSPSTTSLIPENLALTPSGAFLYVSASGGAIAGFSVNPATGALTPTGVSVGGNPTQLAVDPAGKFLFTPYPGFDQVAVYNISQSSGDLGSPVTTPPGVVSGAIAFVQLP